MMGWLKKKHVEHCILLKIKVFTRELQICSIGWLFKVIQK